MHGYHQYVSFYFISFIKFEGQITFSWWKKYFQAEGRRTLKINACTGKLRYLIFWTKLNIKDLIFIFFASWKIITIFCIFGVIANNSFCKPRFVVKTNKVDIKAYLYFSGSSHCPENFSFQILALANWYFLIN